MEWIGERGCECREGEDDGEERESKGRGVKGDMYERVKRMKRKKMIRQGGKWNG